MTNLILTERFYNNEKQIEDWRDNVVQISLTCMCRDNQTIELFQRIVLAWAAFGNL